MKTMIMLLLFVAIVCVSFDVNAEESIDCSKYEGTVWLGEITNPAKMNVRIQIFNNERINGDNLIGLPGPYFSKVLRPKEKAFIEYQCGENSIIFKHGNAYKSLDFHVPNTFFKGDNPLFKQELKAKKTSI